MRTSIIPMDIMIMSRLVLTIFGSEFCQVLILSSFILEFEYQSCVPFIKHLNINLNWFLMT